VVSLATYEDLFAAMLEAAQRKGISITDTSPPTRRTCLANGLALHFLDWGGEQLPPMLLLHGALLQAHLWDFFSLEMRRQFHIHALDLPGHGDSQWSSDGIYSRPRVADAVARLVEKLDLTSLIVIGHSFGGSLGALVAARLADRVRAMVMVDSTLLPTGRPGVRQRAAGGPAAFATFEDFAEHAAGLGGRQRNPARLSSSLRWNARQLENGSWTWKYDPALRQTSLGPSDFEDVWSALQGFPHPVLFVRAGDHSHLSDEAADRLRTLPNVRLVVVPDAAHNVMSDNPSGFRREVAGFLESVNRG
jgi:pimeloyl-ACP methyl ester carboxylesterase